MTKKIGPQNYKPIENKAGIEPLTRPDALALTAEEKLLRAKAWKKAWTQKYKEKMSQDPERVAAKNAKRRARRALNAEQRAAENLKLRERYNSDKEKWQAYNREKGRLRYKSDPEAARRKQRDSELRRNFGISIEDYEAILLAQDYKCAACLHSHSEEPWEKLQLDHCHHSNVIRGLLCKDCNRALGLMKDDPSKIAGLHAYAEKYFFTKSMEKDEFVPRSVGQKREAKKNKQPIIWNYMKDEPE